MPLAAVLSLLLIRDLPVAAVRSEVVQPIRNATFNKGGTAKTRRQGGNPRTVDGVLMFDGSNDGDRQVDPQIAVGGGYVLHGTNSGLVIYDKAGNYVDGVPQREFNDGIDPKMYFDLHARVFVFDLWVYWDKEKIKPVNVSVSETSDPRGAWNTYPVSARDGVDGGGIGGSRRWIGYSFPGGKEQTFVMRLADAKAGKPARVWHFAGSLGHPAVVQDASDDLPFVTLTDESIIVRWVGASADGAPVVKRTLTAARPATMAFGWPPASPQPGVKETVSSGDRNPKNLAVQNGSLWFSHTVNIAGRAGVQWHEVRLRDGKFLRSGTVAHATRSYIQTTIGVNRRGEAILGFQEAGADTFVSPRFARIGRRGTDLLGGIRSLGEGEAATKGGPWGDYSGSCVDGDNRLDLWTIQSRANADGRGATVIARVRP
ncbi:MAG: hypothetical protein SFX74_10580 [Fimbriimonadaceae bacterium]|nr:hypothetical protein [Fimbriimonadaceae bacterium]